MGDKTKIEWAEATWNPVTGCSKVSEGCRNCYALRTWPRLAANNKTVYYGRKFTDVQSHPERLDQPLRWTNPRRIFVNSMSDLFHPDVPDNFILQVFNIMLRATWSGGAGRGEIKNERRGGHIFQVLTKRPERMLDFVSRLHFDKNESYVLGEIGGQGVLLNKGIWLGVSIEDQKTADERIPLLLQTPTAVRWISAEPMLGPVDIVPYIGGRAILRGCGYKRNEHDLIGATVEREHCMICGKRTKTLPTLDWVIVGGESVPNARPMHRKWVRDLRDQCKQVAVPFLFKQWGEWAPTTAVPIRNQYTGCGIFLRPDGTAGNQSEFWDGNASAMDRLGSKTNGRLLDGFFYDEYPK